LASRLAGRKDQTSIKQGSNMTSGYQAFSGAMNLQGLRKSFEPVLRRVFHLYWRFARGMTLGARAVVLDGDNRVFGDALRRELMEEGRIELVGEPALHGLFHNSHVSRRDHVAVYVVRHFRQDRPPEPNREIVASGFFDAAALPAETTEGTRLRISEVLDGKKPIATWR
jgi:8-oxo-dGTP pyrophosphatase MutT (NUDIX family)